MKWSGFQKFWVAFLAAVGVIGVGLSDGTLDASEIGQALVALAGAGAVYKAKNS